MTPTEVRLLAVTGVLAAGLVSACAAPPPPGDSPPAPRATAPAIGLAPASRLLTTRLVLSKARVRAGASFTGTLVVSNHGSTAINLTRRCRPQFGVVLENAEHPPDAAFTDMCSLAPMLMAPGDNQLPVRVGTSYSSCSRGPAAVPMPTCGPGGEIPSLPAGRYSAVLVGHGDLALPAPRAVAVTVTAPAT